MDRAQNAFAGKLSRPRAIHCRRTGIALQGSRGCWECGGLKSITVAAGEFCGANGCRRTIRLAWQSTRESAASCCALADDGF
jgi:hypothetical protein